MIKVNECKFKQMQPYEYSMTCNEVRKNKEKMKSVFREENGTDEIIKMGIEDRMYLKYCEEIDVFLNNCRCLKIPPN